MESCRHQLRQRTVPTQPGNPPVIGQSPTQSIAKGKRQRLVEAVQNFGLTGLMRFVHNRGRSSLIVLAYHRIVPLGAFDDYPLDLELVSATPGEFAWQMRYLREHLHPVSLSAVVDHLDKGTELPEHAVAVTFDDGFGDTYSQAFPVLREYSIPAMVFATTGYLDSGEPFWFEIAAHLMLQAPASSIKLAELPIALPYGDSVRDRRASLRRIHHVLKLMPQARRAQLVSEWQQRFSDLFDGKISQMLRPMNWDEVREMSAAGIEFGAHSVTHPNLSQLSDAELKWELEESKRVIEQRIGKRVDSLAYPIGTEIAYDARVMQAAQAAGFRLALSYVSGVNWIGDFDRFDVRRQGVSLETSRSYFRALLDLPAWVR